jgi:hypothetical protein
MGEKENTALREAGEVRREVVRLLDEYIHLAAQMSEFENAFVTYVLLPGYHLQVAVKKRAFLEEEYKRIRENIEWNTYANSEELVQDIRQTLSRAETEYSGHEIPDPETAMPSESPVAGLDPQDMDLGLTDQEKAAITSQFKRSVVPKVHADTSDAPFEEFNSVLEAYKKKDFLLMQAFIIRYRGDPVRGETESEEEFAGRVAPDTAGDRKVLQKLSARIAGLRRNMTAKELESQKAVLEQLKSQNREVQMAIYKEAEEIVRLQNLLEELTKTVFTVH